MDFLIVGCIGFLFGGFHGAALAIVAYAVLGLILIALSS